MASRGPRVNLQDALLDTPKLHGQLTQLESSLPPFRDYVTLLRDTFQACHLHQEKLGEGSMALANLLSSIDSELGEKTATTSSNAFAQLARYQTELHSCQEMLNSQLQNSVVNRVSTLLDEDMDSIQRLKEACDNCRLEHEYAIAKFSRTSKRKDSDKLSFEANAELYVARKKFYQCSLDYCSRLNEFQMKKKFMLLEPVLTFMHAQLGYFKACHEVLNEGFQQLLTNLNGDVQSYHREFELEARELNQQKAELELQFPSLCIPDPDPSDPFTEFPAANTHLTSKYGYLYFRIQKSGLAAKWERTFFFTKNGYLNTQSLHKSSEALLHMSESEAVSSDSDDRRYVIQISDPAHKKPLFVQAENEVQRTEWLAVINNNSQRKSQHAAGLGAQSSDATRLRTRLYDSLERERIRTWAAKELQQENAPSTSQSSSGLKVTTSGHTGRSKSPQRGTQKPAQTGSGSGDSRAPQRSPGLLGRSGKKTSTSVPILPPPPSSSPSPSLPPTPSGSKLADVESWVYSTTAVAAAVGTPRPPHPPPPSSSASLGKQSSQQTQNGGVQNALRFPVKYLGQTEVQDPKNSATISETIRGVMTARAMKKVKPAHSIELAITHKKITLTDISSKRAVGGFQLKDILNCAAHPENQKLFGVVCRTASSLGEPDKVKYICHVMESELSGAQVCTTISNAIQTAWKMIQSKGGRKTSEGTAPSSSTASTPAKSQGPPPRPPPPTPPYSAGLPSLLYSYSPAPSGLTSHPSHQRSHTATGTQQTQSFSLPLVHARSSSDSNLPNLARPGSGGAGVLSISTQPPSLPASSSTSAESLSLGRLEEVEENTRQYMNSDTPLMFADILEETEDLPLISFDHTNCPSDATSSTLDASSFLSDGYVTSNAGSSRAEFSSPVPPAPSSSAVQSGHYSMSSGTGYMSAPHSTISPSSSPTPPIVTSTQLTLPPHTLTRFSPSPPPQTSPTRTPTPSQVSPTPPSKLPLRSSPSPPPPPLPSSSQAVNLNEKKQKDAVAVVSATPSAKQKENTNSTSSGIPAPAISAADSLAAALGFTTISAASLETDKQTTAATTSTATGVASSTTDSMAEAFGFDTTPEDIENLIELMGPSGDEMGIPSHTGSGGIVSGSGYMSGGPAFTESSGSNYTGSTDWANFGNSN